VVVSTTEICRTGQSTESRAFGTFVTILACARSRAESKRDAVTGDVRPEKTADHSMKPTTTIIALLATLATSYGQDPALANPPKSSPQAETAPATLDANYSITISGGLGDSKSGDVILSGNGPRFHATLPEPRRTIEIILSQKDAVYTVVYSISAQLPINSGNNVQYVDTGITGTYYASLGQPFTVLQVGDKTLSIQIDKTKAKK